MLVRDLLVLTGLSAEQFYAVLSALKRTQIFERGMGRPHKLSVLRRVLLVLVWLRGNLLQSESAILFGVSQATVHRVLQFLVPILACLRANEMPDSKEKFY